MKFHAENEGPPCKNMETLLQRVADGSAKGIAKWYAIAHAARCSHCGAFLDRMKLTLEAVREANRIEKDDDAMLRLRGKLAELEARTK